MSKLSRGQKGEQIVIDTLNDIKEYHHLLNNITLINRVSKMSHQIDHILIHPHGIFIIETKNYYGELIYEENTKQWFKIVDNQKIRISNPLIQNKSHQNEVYHALKGEYKPISVVVFVKNNAPYFPDENVINLKDLILFIESYPYEHKFTNKTIDKIEKILNRKNKDISLDEHVTNIKILKTVKREVEQEKSYAIENNKCPWCDSRIIKEGTLFRCSKCSFRFKL